MDKKGYSINVVTAHSGYSMFTEKESIGEVLDGVLKIEIKFKHTSLISVNITIFKGVSTK